MIQNNRHARVEEHAANRTALTARPSTVHPTECRRVVVGAGTLLHPAHRIAMRPHPAADCEAFTLRG